MSEEEKITMLKALINSSDSNDTFLAYLTLASKKIIARAYPYDNTITDVPTQYDTLQVEIAAYMMNKRGAEGQTSHSENGITRSYEDADIPVSMLNIITPHCGVPK